MLLRNRYRSLTNLLVLMVLATSMLTGCSDPQAIDPLDPTTNEPSFRLDGSLRFMSGEEEISSISIEIADTDASREQGLMYRTSMDVANGMLFIFDRAEARRFWMANTYISLDLLFADADMKIVHIAKYAKPQSQDGIDCLVPAKYVVEVVAGYTDNLGITEGMKIDFSRAAEE